MVAALIWSGDEKLLAATMEELITESQCYLFTVVCGCCDSAGYRWAAANGAPVEFIVEDNIEILMDKIVKRADFLVCYNDGSQYVKRLIMKFKSAGKHGKVVM